MLPLFYFGNIAYWKKVVAADKIEFHSNGIIPKKSYTNRTIIATANGVQSLSIPIEGGRGAKTPFSEIKISYTENWVDKHLMALLSAYSKSPFYEYYIPYFEKILIGKPEKLIDLNLAIFKEIHRMLKLEIPYEMTKSENHITQEFIPNEFCQDLTPYSQVFRYKYEFKPDLSILDLLFCAGNRAKEYL